MKPEILLFYQRREDWLKKINIEKDKIFQDKSRFLQRDYEIDLAINALEEEGFVLHHISWPEDLIRVVSNFKKDSKFIGWNITDGYDIYLGAHFPSTLEMLGIKSVMENSFVQCLSQNKNLLKDILSNQGIRVPRSIVIYKDTKILKSILNFEGPYFLKPVKLDNSIGIRSSYNIEKDKLKAIKKALRLSKVYDTPIMIEEYVDGFDETTPYAFLNGIPHFV